jgi:hypothetical protein
VRAVLPGGVERLSWTTTGERCVDAWIGKAVIPEAALATLLLTDLPLTTEYILWCDDWGLVGKDC